MTASDPVDLLARAIEWTPGESVQLFSGFRGGGKSTEQVVSRRGDWRRLLGDEERLRRLVGLSGGNLDDLLRLVREVTLQWRRLPVEAQTLDAAIGQVRSEHLPIADADALWLAKVHETHRASLVHVSALPDFARLLDTHLVLAYHNDTEWYDAHPLVVEDAVAQARALAVSRSEAG